LLCCAALVVLLGHDALSAVRTGVVFIEPVTDALIMKPVHARQHSDLLAEVDIGHADATLRFALLAEVLLVDASLWQ